MKNRQFAVVACVCILLSGCGGGKQNEGNEGEGASVPAIVPVSVAPVVEGKALVEVEATGRTMALRREKIFSPIAGKITSLSVLEGSTVDAGATLAVVQTKESQAVISGAEALVRLAKTPEQKKEAERTVQLARESENSAIVRAKFKGTVAVRNVSEGEFVAENTELLTLVDLSSVVFLADVPLDEIPHIHTGMSASVVFQSLPGTSFNAKVDALLPQTDIQSQTVQVRLGFSKHAPLLRPEMAGTVRIVTGVRAKALFVPRQALLRNDEEGTYSVMVMTRDSIARTIPVIVGVTEDSMVEVRSTLLAPGTPVITKGNYALADSTKVSVSRKE